MELEKDVMIRFIEYLKEHGYPQNSLATEYRIGEKYRADLVVIDPITSIPIMIFELKSRKSQQLIERGKEQLRMYLKELPDSTIPAYLVFPKENPPYFEVLRINSNEYNNDELETIESIDYGSQRIARLSEKAKDVEMKKKDVMDKFQWIAWVLAFLIAVLLIFKKVFAFSLDTVDLTLIGGVVGLVMIPFASKIKFIGIEFERLNKAKNEEKYSS